MCVRCGFKIFSASFWFPMQLRGNYRLLLDGWNGANLCPTALLCKPIMYANAKPRKWNVDAKKARNEKAFMVTATQNVCLIRKIVTKRQRRATKSKYMFTLFPASFVCFSSTDYLQSSYFFTKKKEPTNGRKKIERNVFFR